MHRIELTYYGGARTVEYQVTCHDGVTRGWIAEGIVTSADALEEGLLTPPADVLSALQRQGWIIVGPVEWDMDLNGLQVWLADAEPARGRYWADVHDASLLFDPADVAHLRDALSAIADAGVAK